MSKMFPALAIAVIVSTATAVAAAEAGNLFGRADCRVATVSEMTHGRVVSSEAVIICKRSPKLEALLQPDRQPLPAHSAEQANPDREQRVAFGGAREPNIECARLDCPTFVLGGVGF